MNAQDELGTVAAGHRADLILIEGNPLEDLANANMLAGAMVRGKWHAGQQLQDELEKLAARFRSESH